MWLLCQGLQGQNWICPSKGAQGQGHLRLTTRQRNPNCMGRQTRWLMRGMDTCFMHFWYILWKWSLQRCRPLLITAVGAGALSCLCSPSPTDPAPSWGALWGQHWGRGRPLPTCCQSLPAPLTGTAIFGLFLIQLLGAGGSLGARGWALPQVVALIAGHLLIQLHKGLRDVLHLSVERLPAPLPGHRHRHRHRQRLGPAPPAPQHPLPQTPPHHQLFHDLAQGGCRCLPEISGVVDLQLHHALHRALRLHQVVPEVGPGPWWQQGWLRACQLPGPHWGTQGDGGTLPL